MVLCLVIIFSAVIGVFEAIYPPTELVKGLPQELQCASWCYDCTSPPFTKFLWFRRHRPESLASYAPLANKLRLGIIPVEERQ